MSQRTFGGYWNRGPAANNAARSPNCVVWKVPKDNYPNIYDINFYEGDEIIHEYIDGGVTVWDIYKLVSLASDGSGVGQRANWVLTGSGTGNVDSLIDQTGAVVTADPGGAISIIGDGQNVNVLRTGDHELTVSYVDQAAEKFFAQDGGHAVPDAVTGRINLYGGSNIETSTSNINTLAFNLGIMNVFGDRDIDLTGHFHSDDYIRSGQVITADLGFVAAAGGIDVTGQTILRDLGATPGLLQADNLGRITASTGAGGLGGWIPVSDSLGVITWKQIQQGVGTVTVINNDITGITIGGGGGGGGGGADTFITNTNSPALMLAPSTISILGDTTSVTTDGGVLNTVTVKLVDDVTINSSLTITGLAATQGVVQADNAGLLYSSGGTDGQILVGVTGGNPVWANLGHGAGIAIVEGAGTLQINNTGGGGGGGTTTYVTDLGVNAIMNVGGEISIFGSGSIETTGSNPPARGLVSISLKDDVNIVSSLNLDWCNHIGVLQVDATGHVYNNYGADGAVLISGGTGPAWNTLTAGAGIQINYIPNNGIEIVNTAVGTGASIFTCNANFATALGPALNVFGGSNMTTSGGGNTVTITLKDSILLPATNTTATQGVIAFGAVMATDRFISSYGTGNTYCGKGSGSLTSVAGCHYNVGVGYLSLPVIGTTAGALGKNVAVGTNSGRNADTTTNSVMVGYGAGFANTAADGLTAVGHASGYFSTTPVGATFLGMYSGYHATTSSHPTYLGYEAGKAGTTAADCTFVGYQAGFSNVVGANCTFVGSESGRFSVASSNSGYGKRSLYRCTSGATNSSFGTDSSDIITTGSNNCAFGYNSLGVQTGSNNIAIGASAGSDIRGATSNTIAIGSPGAAISNKIYIGTEGTHTGCIIAGIRTSVVANPVPVFVNSATGALGVGAGGFMPITAGGTGVGAFGTVDGVVYVASATTLASTNAGNDGEVLTSNGPGLAPTWQVLNVKSAFHAYVPNDIGACTGNGARYVLGARNGLVDVDPLTIEYNRGNNFYAGDGHLNPATYTAPVDGFYHFDLMILYSIPNTLNINRSPIYIDIYNSSGILQKTISFTSAPNAAQPAFDFSAIVTCGVVMTRGWYATFSCDYTLNPPAKTVGIRGASGLATGRSMVSGYLVGV